MKRYYLYALLAWMTLLFCQCSSDEKAGVKPDYNEHVEGFTSGRISRKASAYLLLSTDIESEKLKGLNPNDFMSISPSVNGNFSFADSHTIVFKPQEEMAYNTVYTITAKLKKVFDDDSKDFVFSYQTYPFQMSTNFESFDVDDNDNYVYNFEVRTLDEESPEIVQSLITQSMGNSAKVEWNTENKNVQKMTVTFKPQSQGDLRISSLENSKYDLKAEELVSVQIPNPNALCLYDIRYVANDTKYIEVSFNKQLDRKQNMMGLAYIDGNTSQAVEVSGNKLKLFPDMKREGNVTVHLSKNIRSKNGLLLGEDISQEVTLNVDKPNVEFIGDGTIIPQTDKITVPFRAIYAKGVKVFVFKIYSHNIGQMLANEDINGFEKLGLVGRPVAVTTFYMDESSDFNKWHNYALDLSNLVKTEPGCIYHVELRLDKRLSAWPCDSAQVINKDEIAREDQLLLTDMNQRFDSEIYYYYPSQFADWSKYNYQDRLDPCTDSYYIDRYCAKNVLATNIGLVAMSPLHNKLTVIATNLLTAKAYSGIEVEAYNRQSHLIAKGTTDSDGRVDFSMDGGEGSAFYILARKDADVSCLRVKRGEELSTSTFDVSGSEVQKGLKGYIYGERGVWRPGDTLHLSFMLNDREKTLPENHPVVMELINPLGQTYKKMTKNNGQLGLYTFNIPTEVSDPTGSWLVNIQVGGTTFSKRLRIETIKPNRLKIDLKLPNQLVYGNQTSSLHTEWLNGSKAHEQKYVITSKFVQGTTSFDNWKGYQFDDPTKSFSSKEEEIAGGLTNESGNATVSFNTTVRDGAPGKLRCNITTKVYEESGEFSTDDQIITYSPYTRYVGVKAPNTGERGFIPTGSNQTFDIASVSYNGDPVNGVDVAVNVYKVEWYWWWNCNSYDLADYTTSSYNEPVKKFNLTTNGSGKTSFSLNFPDKDWGTYLIHVTDKSGKHSTGILAYFDWPTLTSARSLDGRETSVTLSTKTDKDSYQPGDVAKLTMPTTAGSRAIVTVCNSAGILDMKFVDCQNGQTVVSIPVTDEMMPNAYIYTTLIQPYQHEGNDLPIRLYGVQPISVSSEKSKLTPVINAGDEVRPLSKYTIKVSEKEGRKMAYTLAVVDEGLLDLTHFKTPNAWSVFFAKEALNLRAWDLYSHVCGAFGGRIDQMFSVGGDEALEGGPKAIVNRFTPMVYFEGPFVVEKGKTNTHEVNVPNYNGRVRVMVVATDGAAYGSAEKSTFVRKPLMVTGTMPRQIGVNDEMTVSATIFAADKSVKNVKTTLTCSGDLQVVGNNTASTDFSEPGDKTVQFKVKAGAKGGTGRVSINCTSSSDQSSYITDITIRTVSQKVKKFNVYTVKPGSQWSEKIDVVGSEQQVIRMEVSSVQPLNMAGRVANLIAYPHGCAEQITSKGFAQLYLDEFSQLSTEQKQEVEDNVKTVISKLAKYQTNDGGMAYWPGSSYPDRWVSAYILLFLDKASEKGYFVNDKMKKSLSKYVASQAKNWKAGSGNYDTHIAAYSLYALANSNAPEKSTMNRMKEMANQLSDNDMNLLAASYALIGQVNTAKQILHQPSNSTFYWCSSKVTNVIANSLVGNTNAAQYAEELRKDLVSNDWMSTIETSMALHAMNIFYKKNGVSDELNFTAKVNKKDYAQVNTKALNWSANLPVEGSSVATEVNNKSKGVMFISVASEGLAVQEPVAASESGVSIKVSYQKDNRCIDLNSVEQGATIKAVVSVTNISGATIENLAVTHILPSGFETLNAQNDAKVSYQDIRDDRVLSYIDVLQNGSTATIILNLSATYEGSYYVPSIAVEAMYNNKIYGCTKSGECVVK